MSAQPFIRCPCCGAEFEMRVQAELPLGPIPLAKKNKLDTQERISHAERAQQPTSQPANSALSSFFSPENNQHPVGWMDAVVVASCEEDLIRLLQKILGERDWTLNAAQWRAYLQECRMAVAYALEDWKLRTPDQQRKIKNRGGWLTDRYKRARAEITKTRKSA